MLGYVLQKAHQLSMERLRHRQKSRALRNLREGETESQRQTFKWLLTIKLIIQGKYMKGNSVADTFFGCSETNVYGKWIWFWISDSSDTI